MNTKVQNFSLVEGSRSRIVIKLPDGADPYSYTVTAGNDRCQQRHLQYEVDSISDRSITMLSEPAPSCMTIPYQLFITDNNSHVEWFVISGNVTVIRRLVGGANTESQEIEPPLSEQVLELNVTLEYSKADLDEAVALALGAASNAQQSAVDAGSSAGLAWDYAQCAHRAVSDIGSSVESAWSAAAQSQESSDLARQYKEQSCCYKSLAFNHAGAAERFMLQAQVSLNGSCAAARKSCGYSNVALNNALCARKWSMCASASKNGAQLSATSAETYKNQAQCYKNQAYSSAATAVEAACNAQNYASAASEYSAAACAARYEASSFATSACNAATTATNKASDAMTWAQCAQSSKTLAAQSATSAQSAKQNSCNAAQNAWLAAQNAWDAEGATRSMIFAGPVWEQYFQNQTNQTNLYTNKVIDVTPPSDTSEPYDLGHIVVCKNATGEIRIDYGTDWGSTEVVFPSCWKWINGDLPDSFEHGHMYRFTVRDDSRGTESFVGPIIANLAYEYEK